MILLVIYSNWNARNVEWSYSFETKEWIMVLIHFSISGPFNPIRFSKCNSISWNSLRMSVYMSICPCIRAVL